jgi:PAS domain S-box-containing protein
VLVLPATSPLRAQVTRVAQSAGFLPVEAVGDAEFAVIDLSGDEGRAAMVTLEPALRAGRITAVVITAPPLIPKGLEAHVGAISPASIESELSMRLALAHARRTATREAQIQQRDLKVLLELTGRYAESTDVEELLHDVTRRLAEEMRIDRAALVVVDGDTGIILAASDDARLKDHRIDLSRYPEIKEVVRTGKPVIVEDAPSHPLLEDVKERVAAQGIQNIAAIPLAVRGKVLGVLLLRRSEDPGAFRLHEIDFLATVGHATAVALRNARQIEALTGQREEEKTARLQAEERARGLQRYEAYFQHLSDGIAILDVKACVLSLNPAGSKLLDVSPAEATGRHINALTNSTDDGLMMDVLLSVARGETRADVDVQARTLGGRKLTLSVSAAPLKEGDAVAILTLRDVTKARQLADELRQTKEFLERLIDSSVDAIIAADMSGKVILFNKAAEAISGWTSDEALRSLNVRSFYPGDQAREVMARLRTRDYGGVGRLTSTRQEILNKAGDHIPVNMTASIIYEGARETATVGIFTDLRDRLQLERKLSDVETRLEESEKNAVLVALAGTAAHELNQPLTSVMGYAELLKRKLKDSDPSFRSVDIIHREAERMAEIVRKIGKITRYETKEYVRNQQIVDLDKATAHED